MISKTKSTTVNTAKMFAKFSKLVY